MKVIALIKKDIFLVKKYLLVILAISIAFPIFISYNAASVMGFAAFMITVMFAEYMALQSVSLAETKYPKAEALLCSSPYMRKYMVVARYLFFALLFIIITLIYELVVAVLPDAVTLSLFEISLTLLIGSILLGICLPLQYKLGYEKMKYVLMVVILLTPFLLPYIVEWLAASNLNISFIESVSLSMKTALCFALTIVINVLSIVASIHIYKGKEL